MCVCVIMMMQLLYEPEVKSNVELSKLGLQFRKRLMSTPVFSKLSPVKFHISHPLAKILQQDDASVW